MLPDPQEAYDTLFRNVHARVFFQKCAAAGFNPRSEGEMQQMLETAGKLRAVSESEQVKAAAAQDNPFFQMNSSLDAVLARHGLSAPRAETETSYKAAADELAADPTLYNSVLSLAAAEAAQVKAEYDTWRAKRA